MCTKPWYLRLQKRPPVARICAAIFVSEQYWPCHTRTPTISVSILIGIHWQPNPPSFTFSSWGFTVSLSPSTCTSSNIHAFKSLKVVNVLHKFWHGIPRRTSICKKNTNDPRVGNCNFLLSDLFVIFHSEEVYPGLILQFPCQKWCFGMALAASLWLVPIKGPKSLGPLEKSRFCARDHLESLKWSHLVIFKGWFHNVPPNLHYRDNNS